jgi:GNAT superfamily N-acetyltransferase
MPSDIVIAEGFRPGALGAVVALHGSYYARAWDFDRRFEAYVARAFADFLDRYDPERDRIFLALDGGRIAGALVIDGGADRERNAARLRFFILDDSCRGGGVGAKLMGAAMDFLKERGFGRCSLMTFAGLDAARALYERSGFRLMEERPFDGWGPPITEQRFEWVRPG